MKPPDLSTPLFDQLRPFAGDACLFELFKCLTGAGKRCPFTGKALPATNRDVDLRRQLKNGRADVLDADATLHAIEGCDLVYDCEAALTLLPFASRPADICVSSISVTVITRGAGSSITSTTTVSTPALGGFIPCSFFRAACFVAGRWGRYF